MDLQLYSESKVTMWKNQSKKNVQGLKLPRRMVIPHGCSEEVIHEFASEGCNTVPCYMPYITSYFMARKMATVHSLFQMIKIFNANLVIFAEAPRDTKCSQQNILFKRSDGSCIYIMMSIVLLPEVFASAYDYAFLQNQQPLDGW